MRALSSLFAVLLAITSVFQPLSADPGDVTAAARGVVRVVLIGQEGDQLVPVTHGSGFAVTPTRIVTNAHVLREALADASLRIGVVPSQGEKSAYARVVAVSPRNDLALLEITGGALRLLALAAEPDAGTLGEVVAVGYPMNVDLAQGLSIGDIFRAQPPVKSRGFLSGERPSRQFDTILHTAPIARGNSGGPLLDSCGRVLGVNSFSADGGGGGGAEFFFAVSLRELIPFLRAQGVEPQVSALPCRSIDELNAEERSRLDAQKAELRDRLAQREANVRAAREEALLSAHVAVMAEREVRVAAAILLLLASLGGGYAVRRLHQNGALQGQIIGASIGAASALFLAGLLWVTRPGVAAIEEKVAEALAGNAPVAPAGKPAQGAASSEGDVLCTLVPERSRVTSSMVEDVALTWAAGGCVNQRTQYGRTNQGDWSRVFVPDDEDAVAVNTYDPATRTFRTERYLLGAAAMAAAREARRQYTPPACGAPEAARLLGEQQSALLAGLPERPNERLVYSCAPKP